ncbi:MAG TPA: response regulator [Burkholderiales bacterium]|nr:response regulator [Burkholderiales bacterium]
MAQRILIVEDEEKLAALLRDYLAQEGYAVSVLHRGDAVEAWVRANGAELVLLDLMLPGKGGLEVCKALRAAHPQLAIIMVTARVDEIDRLLGLELGADDYICKPFSPREVVARVKAVLRRASRAASPAEGLALDDARFKASLGGRDLGLTAVEYQLLKVLASSPGRIFTREQLMDAMYRDERVVSDRTVDSHIKKIRRKLDAAQPGRELIHSLYGVGYKYEG